MGCDPDDDSEQGSEEIQRNNVGAQGRRDDNDDDNPMEDGIEGVPSRARRLFSSLSEMEQKVLITNPKTKIELTSQLEEFVTKHTFRRAKFALGEEEEKKVCRVAAFRKVVVLPRGVTREVFGENYYGVVRARMRMMKRNCHSSAKTKFDGERIDLMYTFVSVE